MVARVFAIILLSCLLHVISSVEWIEFQAAVNSPNVVSKEYFGTKRFFCRDVDLDTGLSYTGVVQEQQRPQGQGQRKRRRSSRRRRTSDQDCQIVVGRDVMASRNFKVLSLSANESRFSFAHAALLPAPQRPPSNAVACRDPDIPAGSCFLGASVYGDGICEEGLGKVDLATGLVQLAVAGRRERCPFFRFLVVG